ncbi:hypothetical protein SO802_028554 [Lithocarpus litseifolius]|uniref:t-SNARE coiled-coil homology domain-containing protein n=1 Tax=Lithocarpus litseifolius TaxID=425828 RepID=A0AAW2BTT4_9ROSI
MQTFSLHLLYHLVGFKTRRNLMREAAYLLIWGTTKPIKQLREDVQQDMERLHQDMGRLREDVQQLRVDVQQDMDQLHKDMDRLCENMQLDMGRLRKDVQSIARQSASSLDITFSFSSCLFLLPIATDDGVPLMDLMGFKEAETTGQVLVHFELYFLLYWLVFLGDKQVLEPKRRAGDEKQEIQTRDLHLMTNEWFPTYCSALEVYSTIQDLYQDETSNYHAWLVNQSDLYHSLILSRLQPPYLPNSFIVS